jgi:hypothetical protein
MVNDRQRVESSTTQPGNPRPLRDSSALKVVDQTALI